MEKIKTDYKRPTSKVRTVTNLPECVVIVEILVSVVNSVLQ